MADAAAELETISDDVVEGDVVPSPKRPRLESSKKYSGASIYKSKYKVSWEKKWPFVTAVRHDQHSFYCKHCSKIVSCAHQGERDVVRHIASNQHKKNSKSVQNTAPLNFASSECINKVHCIYILIICYHHNFLRQQEQKLRLQMHLYSIMYHLHSQTI